MNKESNTTETAIDVNRLLTGVFVYLTSNPAEAWKMIEKLSECRNCCQYSKNLFEHRCNGIEDSKSFELSSDNSSCECFYARSKKVNYWINKLASMAMEYDGINDFMRQLEYHQKNGTDSEFLGFK